MPGLQRQLPAPADLPASLRADWYHELLQGTRYAGVQRVAKLKLGMTETEVDALADEAVKACRKFWEAYTQMSDDRKAVVYCRNEETGETFAFTRSEYSDALISFVISLNKL